MLLNVPGLLNKSLFFQNGFCTLRKVFFDKGWINTQQIKSHKLASRSANELAPLHSALLAKVFLGS